MLYMHVSNGLLLTLVWFLLHCQPFHTTSLCGLYSEYEDDMHELQDTSILDIVLALQKQGAIGNFKNSR